MARGPQKHIATQIDDILAFWRWGPLLDQHTGTLQKCIINPTATGSIASIVYIWEDMTMWQQLGFCART
jgi:hypothetical protein